MTSVVVFTGKEQAQTSDFENVGIFARRADQGMVGGAIGYPHHWSRFTIAQPTAITLEINPGLLFVDDVMYEAPDIIPLNLQIYLPLVTGDFKWVALLARGSHVVENANRMVKVYTDVDSGQLVQQSVPKTDRLKIEIVVQDGLPSPVPIKPSVPGDQCCLAFVRMSTTGIIDIEPGETWRLKTLYEVEGRVTQLEGDLTNVRQRTAQLETDFAWLASQLRSIPRPEIIEQMKRDLAATRRILALPDSTRAYWYDPGLVMDEWDAANANWVARVREGVRFAFAQIVDSQMSLLNPANEALKIVNSLVLPAWTEVLRISVEGNEGSKDISQQVHTVTEAIQNTISRTSVSYGPSISVCENAAEWSTVASHHPGETFNVNGTEYLMEGLETRPVGWVPGVNAVQWNADPATAGHKVFAVQQKIVESWNETYWTYIVHTFGVNGSVYAQSFLNSQQMIMTSIDLQFTRVGSDGEVHLFLCKLDSTGAPRFDDVIASTSIPANQITTGWNKFRFTPTLLEIGARYAWFTVTVGNHALATVSANKYAQGSLFWCTDGAWAQGDPLTDFAFRIYAASFASVRTVAEFAPLTCPLGMTEIQLLYKGWAPPGTSLTWEIKPTGMADWQKIDPTPDIDDNPLIGLPALAQLRATFIGTTDLMPAIVLDTTARSAAMRMRPDMKAVSDVINFGLSATSIVVQTIVDSFYPDHNTFNNRLIIGTTVYTPLGTTFEVDRDKPTRRTYRSTFTVPATTSVRYHALATTDNVVLVPFIQNVAVYAL
jgi:hypothetical protein